MAPIIVPKAGGGSSSATSLVDATGSVDVSAATAPSTGQALTATDSTHATWQAIVAPTLKSATTSIDVAAATAPSSGQVLTATDSTHATWQTPAAAAVSSGNDPVVTGFLRTVSRAAAQSAVTMTAGASGNAYFCYFTADQTVTLAKLGVLCSTAAVTPGSSPTAQVALYSAGTDDALTWLANTAVDTTLWNAGYNLSSITSGSGAITKGNRYAIGFHALASSFATAPQFSAAVMKDKKQNAPGTDAGAGGALARIWSAQTALPLSGTTAASNLTINANALLLFGTT